MITERRKQILKKLIMDNCANRITDCDGDSYFEIMPNKLVNYLSNNLELITEIIKNDKFGLEK